MNNALTIILILITLVSAFLYLRAEKKNKDLKDGIGKVTDSIQPSLNKISELENIIDNLNAENNRISNLIRESDVEIRHLTDQLNSPKQPVIAEDIKHIFYPIEKEQLNSIQEFVQSSDISPWELRLSAKDIFSKEQLNVIKGLDQIGLFPKNLQEDFNFNPKIMAVRFELQNRNEEGEIISFKSWLDFLLEREKFIKVISSYVESVINQRKINQAVDEALDGKEATSV